MKHNSFTEILRQKHEGSLADTHEIFVKGKRGGGGGGGGPEQEKGGAWGGGGYRTEDVSESHSLGQKQAQDHLNIVDLHFKLQNCSSECKIKGALSQNFRKT